VARIVESLTDAVQSILDDLLWKVSVFAFLDLGRVKFAVLGHFV